MSPDPLPPRQYHANPRPEFPPPALYGAIRQAWETLRDSDFADEGGPLRNRHEFLQIGELLTAFQQDINEGNECHETMPHYF